MKILIIDNYDSFTYNLVQMVEDILYEEVDVVKNDKIDFDVVLKYDKIILSPGPGLPSESGKLMDFIQKFHDKIPMLGVCLGQQAMFEFFGGKLIQLHKVHHGVASHLVEFTDEILFKGLTIPVQVGRYHSWVVDKDGIPPELKITSTDENGIIMSIKHKHLPLTAVQFHPESILTPKGKIMLENWLNA